MINNNPFPADPGRNPGQKSPLAGFFRSQCFLALFCLSLPMLLAGFGAQAATVVGRLPGDFAVGPGGSATFRIPIKVAAGQNGMKPDIALTYDSERGDGLAGVGWTIAGISEITRCGLIPALDGKFQGIRFSHEDRYCLDGQPLIQLSAGNYWGGGQEYRPEIHRYEKVSSFGSVGTGNGTGPKYFEVRRRNGLIYRYGFNPDSRVEATGNSDGAVRIWALDEIRDLYNTRVFFSYEKDPAIGALRPAAIKWSARSGQNEAEARYRLKFLYEDRPARSMRSGFNWGSVWTHARRLRYIDYAYKESSNFVLVHRYALSYRPSAVGSGRSVLSSVQQCGPVDCLLPTRFVSNETAPGWQVAGTSGTNMNYQFDAAIPGDFNGDGRQDFFVPMSGVWAVVTGTWSPASGTAGLAGEFATGMSAVNVESTRAIDYNGDGLSDLLTPDAAGSNWHIYQSNGVTLSDIDIAIPKSEFSDPIILDLNGDGFDDILYRFSSSTMYVRINNGNGFDAPVVATNRLDGIGPDLTYQGATPDFDGDGRDDYFEQKICYGEGCAVGYYVRIYLSNGAGFDYAGEFSLAAGNGQDTISQFNQPSLRSLDVNGDGLSDLMYLAFTAASGWTWYTVSSHGNGFEPAVNTMISYPAGNPNQAAGGTPYAIADYDMDGRDDLLVGKTGSGGGWSIYPSNGSTFTATGIPLTGVPVPGSNTVFVMDIGGTGYASLIYRDSQWNRLAIAGHAGINGGPKKPDTLVRVTDGLGNHFDIDWKPISQVSGFAVGPLTSGQREVHAGRYVVSNYAGNDGTGSGDYSMSYLYSDPRRDLRGRGFLGFNKVRITDSRDGRYSESTYLQVFPFTGLQDLVLQHQPDGKIISGFDPAWDEYPVTVNDGTYHFLHLRQSPATASVSTEYEVDPDSASNGLLTRSITRKVRYDFTHGEISRDISTVRSPVHSSIFTTTVDTVFESFAGSGYCLGYPGRIDVTRSDSVEPAQVRTRQYTYNSFCSRLSKVQGPANDPGRQLVTTYGIDSYGKTISITRDSGDGLAPDRRTTIGWDLIGGYRPVTATAEISGETGLTDRRTWNYGLGLESSHTDPRGLTTSWQYDDFGRLSAETRPGPASTSVTIENCTGNCFPGGAQYKVRAQRSDGFWSERYYDSYGRVVGRAGDVLAGTATTEARMLIDYDSLGRISLKTEPYLMGDTQYSTSYFYDLRGRIKRERRTHWDINSFVANTDWAYDRLTVVVKDARGNRTSYFHDAAGRLIETQAPLGSGSINAYWPDGKPKSVTQDGVIIKSLTYDARGFPATLTDVDSGTRHYQYNVFGELVGRTDDIQPTPHASTMVYDQLGRPRQRIEDEGITDWVYYQSGNGLGLLREVTGPLPYLGHAAGSCTANTGYCEQYSYDSNSRVRKTVHRFAGNSYVTNYGYNNEGQVTSITYPAMLYANRYTFRYRYSGGHLDTIEKEMGGGATQKIYDVVNQDAFGNVSLSKLFGQFGSGETEYDHQQIYYGTNGRIRSIKTGMAPFGENIQNYDYTWDKVGNLVMRRDNNQGNLTEAFVYDSLNRLEKSFVNTVETSTIKYAANGNILSRSDIGTYLYGGAAGSRAVTSVSNGPGTNTYHYDANGNMDCRGGDTGVCTSGNAIRWTSFNKPEEIDLGTDYAAFDYGPDRRRLIKHSRMAGFRRNTQYIGTHFVRYIENGKKTSWQANIFANGRVVYRLIEHQTVGACTSQQGSQGYFVLRDHQNSVDVLLNDGTSNDSAFSFDAFGKRRNVSGWTPDDTDSLASINRVSGRGYTGHEHLDNVRLIHMNGRVQDPVLGRMISPDPGPWNPGNPQSLNSYSYVMNNPLSLVDPSGFEPECGKSPGPACESGIIQLVPTAVSDIPSSPVPLDEMISFADPGQNGGLPVPLAIPTLQLPNSGVRDFADRLQRVQSRVLDNLTVTVPREGPSQSRFSSARDLNSALSSGDGVFGKRPLNLGIFAGVPVDGFEAPLGDLLNIELLHEQFFFKDENGVLKNMGFFNSGAGGVIGPDPDFPGNISLYKFGPVYPGIDIDSLDFAPPGFGPGTYDLGGNNCQSYCDAIRDQL